MQHAPPPSNLRNRGAMKVLTDRSSSSEDDHPHTHHDHQHTHHHMEDQSRPYSSSMNQHESPPNLLISCCTNTTYMILVLCLLFGLFIINENLSLFKYMKEERMIDFERQFMESTTTTPPSTSLNSTLKYHLLFVHGAFGSKEEFTSRYFPFFMNLQNSKISSIGAFSWTGHGKSHHSNYIKYLRMMDYVNDLEYVIEKYYKKSDFKDHHDQLMSDFKDHDRQLMSDFKDDHGHKLILVCHSLGGLICQKYLDSLSRIPLKHSNDNNRIIPLASMILLTSAPPVSRFDNILSNIRFDPLNILLTNLWTFTIDAIAMSSIHHTKHYFYHEKTSIEYINKIHQHDSKLQSEGLIFYLDSLTCTLNAQSMIEMFQLNKDEPLLFSHPFHIRVLSIEKDSFFTTKQHEKTIEYWNLIANGIHQKIETPTRLKVSGEMIPSSVQVGHMVMLDVDWKEVANKIVQFVQEDL